MKKKLLVDLDYVICYPGFLTILNKFLNTNYKEEDFKEYIIDDIIGPQEKKEEFYNFYLQHNGYDDAILMDDVKEVLKNLMTEYDIYICTACVMFGIELRSGKLYMDKFNYLIKEFPFLDPRKFIFTNSKNLFDSDVQIDDRIHHLQGNVKTKLLYDAYHNHDIDDETLNKANIKRVKGWRQIEKLLLG